jgi:hypothetical protein
MRRRWMFMVPAVILGVALFTWLGGTIVRLLGRGRWTLARPAGDRTGA